MSLETLVHGGGTMGERIHAFDWSHHPLGPPELWPQSLKTILRVILTARHAMWVGWGPELYFFYNDAYAPTLGIKDSWALGTPAAKLWTESWETLGPRVEAALRNGTATWNESLRLLLERSGYVEETYHTLSCSPVPDDDGSSVGGVLGVTTEETERVVSERRLSLLHELTADFSQAKTQDGFFRAIAQRFAARPEIQPFALIYLFDSHGTQARLVCSHGVTHARALAPEIIVTQAAAQTWPVSAILDRTPWIVVDDLPTRFPFPPSVSWERAPRQAVVVPLALPGGESPAGFLVIAINPYRALDDALRRFIDQLAEKIATGLASVREREAERQHAEALAELDRSKTIFLSNVSHELRAPLTLMLAPMEDLLSAAPHKLAPRLHELAAVAHRNGMRLLKLVNAILDFSAIETGRTQTAFEPTDLARYTSEIISSFRATVERAGLKLVVDCPPLPEPVFVDRGMWEKIVLNLLSNAFKFTLHGQIRVSLHLVGDCVEFSVQDTGAGIPPDAQPHLFQRFFRVLGTPGRTDEGAGIGLALVHELVKLHGGSIHVDSEEGVGSTFTVFLRTGSAHLPTGHAAGRHAPPADSAIPAFAEEASGWMEAMIGCEESDDAVQAEETFELPDDPGGKVLVVDDNFDMRRYLARLLAARFEVLTAPDGATALEIVQAQKPDLVLADALMPRLDGFGLLKAIRSRPALRTTPVILLSAQAGEESRIEGLDAGADDFLVKPFSARELLARVNVHVQMARIRRQAEARERELRTRAEIFASALRESNERLSASLSAAGTGTFRWDLRTNTVDWDEPLSRLFGLQPGRKLHSLAEFVQLVHPDDRAGVQAACDRSMKSGESFDFEFRVPQPDGSTRWLDDKGQMFFDETGKPAYMTGACVDITTRKQAEMFVWRQRDVLEQIVQGAPLTDVLETLTLDVEQVAERKLIAAVTMMEPDGEHLQLVAGRRVPPGWSQVFEHVPIGNAGTCCGVAAQSKERVIVRDVMTSRAWEPYRSAAVQRGIRASWSTPIISSRGDVLGTIAIYYPDPSVPTEQEIRFVDIVARTAAIAVERHESERALMESRAQLAEHAQRLEERVQERTGRLRETVSELESFSYSISHDMRAPLRAMQSFAQILAEDCGAQISQQGRDYIRRIISASDRMDRLIQDVLTYSRVARTELQLEPVDVEKLLDDILESYPHFQVPRARIAIRRPIPRVMGHFAALTQCFSNLIDNAIKFVPPGVMPHVEIWSEPLGGRRVRLYVRDNGIGIEPQAYEKIFQIFHQLDRSYEGTGIGLSIVRKAIERMGGNVGVTSVPHQGSTFHLELNLAP